MKQWIKDLLSNSENVSSNRLGFLILIFCVPVIICFYIIIAIKGIVWNLPIEIILTKMNDLVLIIVSSGIVTKNIGGFVEYLKSKKDGA